jgi:hypothetical protein
VVHVLAGHTVRFDMWAAGDRGPIARTDDEIEAQDKAARETSAQLVADGVANLGAWFPSDI